jgi:hypothetical protein
VVSLPVTVSYDLIAFGVDQADLPIVCVGHDGDFDGVEALMETARGAIGADRTLKGTAQEAHCTEERSWRRLRAGGTEMTAVDLIVQIRM